MSAFFKAEVDKLSFCGTSKNLDMFEMPEISY